MKSARVAKILFATGIVLALCCRLDILGHALPSLAWRGLQVAIALWLIVALGTIRKAPALAIPGLVLLYLFPFSLLRAVPTGIPGEQQLLRYLQANTVVGASIGVHAAGRTYFAGYGGVEKFGARPTAVTYYPIASVTKTFTGHVLGENLDASLVPLATHSSGLPDITAGPGFALRFLMHPFDFYAHYDAEDLQRDLAHFNSEAQRRELRPGRWQYSNMGFCQLGRELRMHARSFGSISYERPDGAAASYNAAGVRTAPWSPGVCHGAGGLHANAVDLLEYARRPSAAKTIHFDDGEQVMGLGWMYRDGIWYHSGATYGNTAFIAHDPGADIALVVLISGVARDIDGFGIEFMRELSRTSDRAVPPQASLMYPTTADVR